MIDMDEPLFIDVNRLERPDPQAFPDAVVNRLADDYLPVFDLGRLVHQERMDVFAGWRDGRSNVEFTVEVRRPVQCRFVLRFARELDLQQIKRAGGFTLCAPLQTSAGTQLRRLLVFITHGLSDAFAHLPDRQASDRTITRALLVSRDVERSRAIARLLAEIDIDIFTISPAELRQHLATGSPDLVLVDLQLADSPNPLLDQLTSAPNADWRRVVVLFDVGQERDVARALECGASDAILRTCEPAELISRLVVLQLRHSQQPRD